ncbi:MAG: hypothetical protein IPO21_19655 [Bacteroidales bacterium]|nr:hypothetical protein [Bacteroidales bacterium]
MITFRLFAISILLITFISCSKNKNTESGFSVSPVSVVTDDIEIEGITQDSNKILTRPTSVLLTAFPEYRLTTIYKLNYNISEGSYYTGSNNFYSNYTELGQSEGNQWNYNFMPGLQAVYGFNFLMYH